MIEATARILARNRLFRGLPARIIERLARIAAKRTYKRHQGIFSQGEEGDALFCLVMGRARISAVGASGREVFLNIMEPGDSFGEIAVVDGLPRTASAKAMDPVVALSIGRDEFLDLLREEPELTVHLLRLFCERVRWTSGLFEDSAFMTGPARLAKRLLSLALVHGKQTADGFELRISQGDLARFLGLSRQIVNQHLRAWRDEGWIDMGRSRLVIRDAASLERVAGALGQSESEARR